MKITRIDVFQVDLPHAGGTYHLSNNRSYTTFDATIVRITTDTGLEGWGESTPFGSNYIAAHAKGVRAGIAEIAPALIGLDPRRVDRVYDAMDATLTGHAHAKTALDVACWDIFGKSVGLPVCELLGGRTDARLPIISSIPVGTPEKMCQNVAIHRDRGYRAQSIKIEGHPSRDAARLKAIMTERQPDEFFLVDANGGLSVETALRMLQQLQAGDMDLCLEAPCATWRGCMSLRKRTSVPIIFDELSSDDGSLIHMVADDAVDGIGLKISKAGGLTKARRHRDLAIAAGYRMSAQETCGSDIAFSVIVHLAQTVPEKWLQAVLECRDMVTVKTADDDFEVNHGSVCAPHSPGLGIKPRMETLGKPVASYF